ncbi:hypothetical protein NYR75_02840 [Actinobacillus equuli subsp. haemolyticus]|uniref:Uncharacterized protein n=1 Tax=Actinobacillus equuli subsp. equuli TaxID=202947 RepID=A0A9X4JD69_ACTEU|nr:hypothetical protein [Actinobacillus equuli]MDE8034633.1 hypothetical protein [Actinobacillus equuli subsp. equuli]MDG4948731.1 hypothetical protein [Actinobacillus equuli subsp. haemolyticus]WGE63778.1 hypothetical protein NYR75_02840 [Actinobacillus equuli subsp. haemolyticus]
MKAIIFTISLFTTIITVCGFATYLMATGVNGWGWLIFIAFLCTQFSYKDKKNEQE